MIRTISTGLLCALITYLLATTNNEIGVYGFVAAGVAFLFGFIVVNESQKQAERTDATMLELKEALNAQNNGLKALFVELGKQNSEIATNLRNSFFEYINNIESTISSRLQNEMNIMVPKVTSPMKDSLNDLQSVIDSLHASTEAITLKITEALNTIERELSKSYEIANRKGCEEIKEAMKSINKDIDKTINDLSDIANGCINYSKERDKKIDNTIQEQKKEISEVASSVNNILDDLKDVINSLQSSTNDIPTKITETLNTIEKELSKSYEIANRNGREEIKEAMKGINNDMGKTINNLSDIANGFINYSKERDKKIDNSIQEQKKEISKVASSVNDILDDLKDVINSLQTSTDDIPTKINETLNNIEQYLSDNFEKANDEGREEMIKAMKDIRNDISEAIDNLSNIAVKFTDYEKEQDIIRRLEKLCK